MFKHLFSIFFSILWLSIWPSARAQAQPCQTINVHMVSSNPAGIGGDGNPIRVCQNSTVTITASVSFSDSIVPAMYIWSYGDDTPLDTTNNLTMSHTYVEGGVYIVDLLVVDSNGCTNTNRLGQPIQVSTTPLFTNSAAADDTICLNQTTILHIEATPVPGIYNCAPPVADTTFLPDGSGVSYTTTISVECFAPGAQLTDTSQITSVCIDMEHSYMGDLDWTITCPNNQVMSLHDFSSGGGTILGFPVATDLPVDGSTLTNPGIGINYCFAPTGVGYIDDPANSTNVSPYTDPIGNISTNNPINQANAGTYKADGSWGNLVGCPLNGDWTITITDHLGLDNGNIFGWSIDFDPSLLPGSYSFTPDFPIQGWTPHPDIIAITNNGHDIEVKPSTAGLQSYTYTVTDNFGCSYDTSIYVYVIDPGNPGKDTTFNICLNNGNFNVFDYLGGSPDPGGVWTGSFITSNGIFDPAAAGVGTHDVVYTLSSGSCDTSVTATINVVNDVVIDFSFEIMKGCTADTVQFTNLSEPGNYWWNYGDGSSPDDTTANPLHIYQDQDEYPVRLIVESPFGCRDSVTKIVDVRHPLIAGFIQSIDSVCQTDGTLVQFTDTSVGAQHYFWDFGDGDTSNAQSPGHVYARAGYHEIRQVISDDIPCYDTARHYIYVDSLPHLTLITDKDILCEGDAVVFTLDYLSSTAQNTHWDFGDGVQWDDPMQTRHSYDEAGEYTVVVEADYPVCASTSDTALITVYEFPGVNLGADSSMCLDGNPIYLQNLYGGNDPLTKLKWSTGDTTAVLKVVHPGTYSLTASLNECATTESVIINKDCYTDVPNAFTPNGDGDNDYFFPRQYLSEGVTHFTMTIYNRWGQKIFETSRPDGRGWDGRFNDKDQPVGVYIYQISVAYQNGREEQYNGNVTLIR